MYENRQGKKVITPNIYSQLILQQQIKSKYIKLFYEWTFMILFEFI